MVKNLNPDAVFDFYVENRERIKKRKIQIAESTSGLYKVYIESINYCTVFSVYEGGKIDPICKEDLTKIGAAKTVSAIYGKYFIEFGDKQTEKKEEEDPRITLVKNREKELLDAVKTFVNVSVIGGMSSADVFRNDSDAKDTLDKFLEILAYDLGAVIYRPTFVEVNGERQYVEYPYEEPDDSLEEDT